MRNGAVSRRVAGSAGIARDDDKVRRNNICAGW